MNNYPKTCVTISFTAGIIVAFLFQEKLKSIFGHPTDRKTVDHGVRSAGQSSGRAVEGRIVQGIEGCIGNTPLLRIKSLSDATGCDILGKAEVCYANSLQ